MLVTSVTGFSQHSGIAQTAELPESKAGKPFVIFQQNNRQKFGFDGYQFREWHGDYAEWVNDHAENYKVAYKSVGENEADVVDVRLINGNALPADSLEFYLSDEQENRLKLTFTERNGIITLFLPARAVNYTVVASYGNVELGQLSVAVYPLQTEKVILVPLIPFTIGTDSLATRVNRIYRQANLQVGFELKPLFSSKELDTTILFDNPSTSYDRYTAQMQKVRDLYFERFPQADRTAYYLFVIPGFNDPAIKGYMVRNKAMGFITLSREGRYAVTIARNLARGIGLLKDSWVEKGPVKGSTDNLMDRTKGTHLRHIQWEDLRHSSHSFSFFDNYEDVQTNNGIVAFYFWREDAKGNILLTNGSLLQSVKRPFKKNYLSYHLNIDNFLLVPLFTIRGRMVSITHLLAVIAIGWGVFYFGRKLGRYLKKRLKRPRLVRFTWRLLQFGVFVYAAYLSFLLVDLAYGWYEVKSGTVEELDAKSPAAAIDLIALNNNVKHPSENELCSEVLINRGKKWYMQKNRHVLYFELKKDSAGNYTKARLHHDGDSLILPGLGFYEKAESHYFVINFTAENGKIAGQKVFNHLGIDITAKLRLPDPAKRILILVGGYRPTSVGHTFEDNFKDIRSRGLEFPDSRNLVYNFDRYDYWRPWQAMDQLFQKRVNPVETFYADGHFSVSTSNHRSLLNFSTTSAVYPKRCTNTRRHTCYMHQTVSSGFYGGRAMKTIKLHRTRSNKSGFWKRRMNGRVAGRNIYQMMNELPNKSGNDTIYIVAHSMGYAYALGIMDELRGKVHFGDLYIIAPENAAAGNVHLSEWLNVWQYGSNFNPKHYEPPCLLDGVAPQAKAGGIYPKNRIFIPRQFYNRKGFFDSHFIGYYTWIFDIAKGKPGYIPQR